MRNERLEIRPASGALGTEIIGVDLSQPPDQAEVGEIRSAFHGCCDIGNCEQRHKQNDRPQ